MAAGHVASTSTNPIVLVVDDHADTSAMYALDLTRRGFRVITASSAEDATALLANERLAVVVLDSRLPGEQGTTLALRLRQDARTCDAVILMLSGDLSARPRALAAGCDEFLLKPCIPEQLAAAISAGLLRRRALRADGHDHPPGDGPSRLL